MCLLDLMDRMLVCYWALRLHIGGPIAASSRRFTLVNLTTGGAEKGYGAEGWGGRHGLVTRWLLATGDEGRVVSVPFDLEKDSGGRWPRPGNGQWNSDAVRRRQYHRSNC